MTTPGFDHPHTWTQPLKRATLVVYLLTALLLLLFPLSLTNWLDDKDWSTVPFIRPVLPVIDAIASLGPAGWNAGVRERAKGLMKRPE